MASDDLHPILSKIHRTLGDVRKSIEGVRGEVEKIREAVTKGVTKITEAIDDNTRARAELKLMERVVEVRSILPQIEAEQERVETEREELDRQLDRIAERYEEKHEELDRKAAARVRDLGAHIFEIDEAEFEDGIETPFVEHVTTAWRALQSQNDAFGDRRRERIESATGDAVARIHDFVEQQHELVEQIRRVRTDVDRPGSEPTRIQLPYYVVAVETGGTTERHVVLPSTVTEAEGRCGVSLEPLPGMERLVSPTDLAGTHTERVESSAIREALEPHVSDDPPLLSYGDAVEESVPDRIDVAIEGGS
jgi:uncharacterized protein YoxC